MRLRTGIGFDVHQLVPERKLIIGGIEIPNDKGCLAHSDGDVLIHAICDALLGAAALGDIGTHFPDTDNLYRDIDSRILLEKVFILIKEKGFEICNIDCIVTLQKPKIKEFVPAIRAEIAGILNTAQHDVSVKATTTEKLGFTGRGEGIAAWAVVLLLKQ
jgi:2-C-methyl-D-erythritol 2,4-cyclodiphosphate synthase